MQQNSKRHAWIIAECREWIKTNHPSIYSRIYRLAKVYFPNANRRNVDRSNLITMVLVRVMRIKYTEHWYEIVNRSDEIYGLPRKSKKRLGQIAWEIAITIGGKNENTPSGDRVYPNNDIDRRSFEGQATPSSVRTKHLPKWVDHSKGESKNCSGSV